MPAARHGDDEASDHAIGELALASADATGRDRAAHVAAIERGHVIAELDL